MHPCEDFHGGNKSVSVVVLPNAPHLDYQLDRAEWHGLNIKKLALSTHMIELDNGVLSLRESIKFFSLSSSDCSLICRPFLPYFSTYDILFQELYSNNLRNVYSTHIINSLPLLINEILHIA